MTLKVDLRNGTSTTAKSTEASRNFILSTRLWTWDNAKSFLYFSMPFNKSSVVVDARLRLFAAADLPAGMQVELRPITQQIAFDKITWNNQPTVGAVVETLVLPAVLAGGMVEMDLTDTIQAMSGGAPYLGWQLTSTADTEESFHSFTSDTSDLRPRLVIEWADPPAPPSNLFPRGDAVVSTDKPTLQFTYVDSEGANTMQAMEIQLDTDGDFSVGAYAYPITTNVPILNLADTTFPGMTPDVTFYWRARAQDTSGLWSDWSEVASMKYVAKPTVTITSPVNADTIGDPTPTIQWTLSAGVQKMFQIFLVDITGGGNTQVFDSGLVAGASNQYQLPLYAVNSRDDHTFRVVVRVWENSGRVATAGSPAYVQGVSTFTFDRDDLLASVDNLRIEQNSPNLPFYTLKWDMQSTETVFGFIVYRDDEVLTFLPKASFALGGINFGYFDPLVSGRKDHIWYVAAVYDGYVTSKNNPSVTQRINRKNSWLVHTMGGVPDAIPFLNADFETSLYEVTDIAYPVNADPVLIRQSLRRMLGECTAEVVHGYLEKDSEELKKALQFMRENPYCVLMWDDNVIEAQVYNLNFSSNARADGETDYFVSFSFLQVGA